MNLQPGDIVLIRIDFHQSAGGKVRPAVVLLDSGDSDFVAAPITSRPRTSEFDVVIQDWRSAGLNVASTVRIHKLTVLAKQEIVRHVGVSASLIVLLSWIPYDSRSGSIVSYATNPSTTSPATSVSLKFRP